MKINKHHLKKIIKEELNKILNEEAYMPLTPNPSFSGMGFPAPGQTTTYNEPARRLPPDTRDLRNYSQLEDYGFMGDIIAQTAQEAGTHPALIDQALRGGPGKNLAPLPPGQSGLSMHPVSAADIKEKGIQDHIYGTSYPAEYEQLAVPDWQRDMEREGLSPDDVVDLASKGYYGEASREFLKNAATAAAIGAAAGIAPELTTDYSLPQPRPLNSNPYWAGRAGKGAVWNRSNLQEHTQHAQLIVDEEFNKLLNEQERIRKSDEEHNTPLGGPMWDKGYRQELTQHFIDKEGYDEDEAAWAVNEMDPGYTTSKGRSMTRHVGDKPGATYSPGEHYLDTYEAWTGGQSDTEWPAPQVDPTIKPIDTGGLGRMFGSDIHPYTPTEMTESLAK